MEPMFRATRPLSSSNRHQRRASAKRSRGKDTKHRLTKAQRDAINKAADHFIDCGCDYCGTPAVPGFPAFCVLNGADVLVACSDCTTGQNLEPLMAVIPNVPVDPWWEDDRDWFAANPERMLRLRKTMPGELQATMTDFGKTPPPEVPGYYWVTITYQIRPGERTRTFRQVPYGAPIDSLSDLEIAVHVFGEGDLETAEQRYDEVLANPDHLPRIDALIRRMQSRLSRFEEDAP
jgi:hypothetical protein